MTRTIAYKTVSGDKVRHICKKPGPPTKGYKSILVDLPPEHIAVMKAINAECGGMLAVNEQIRRAVRAYLMGGLVYISPLKS